MILPAPQTDGGRPLMQALKERKSTREFSGEKLPVQVLANMLSAIWREPSDGRRTAPSAMNWQEIEIYVVTADGAYVYDASEDRAGACGEGRLADPGGDAVSEVETQDLNCNLREIVLQTLHHFRCDRR